MARLLENIRIVLVNPQDAKNVGAVCRAMKTMHITSLAIVTREKFNLADIKNLAIHAYDVFEHAMMVPHLEQAVEDISLVAGITRRRGKKRKYFSLSPEELIVKIKKYAKRKVALVFGNEESGLTDSELKLCHISVNIPSSPLFPSLNLSHAVQIFTYLLYRHCPGILQPKYTPITDKKLKVLVGVIIQSLRHIGFFTRGKPEDLGLFIKDIFARCSAFRKRSKKIGDNISKNIRSCCETAG